MPRHPFRLSTPVPTPALALTLAVAAAAAGCSAGDAESAAYYDDDSYGGAPTDGDGGEGDDDGGFADDDDSAPPPEEENDFLTAAPAAVDEFVFVVNTERDTVSKINANTLAVTTLPTGSRPIQVEISGDGTRAVTFNADSDDLTVVDVSDDTAAEVQVREDLNTLVLSPSGGHALVYYDTDNVDLDPSNAGVHSLNDVSVVDLDGMDTVSFAVGFQPLDARFTQDGTLAVMVSDEALALIDLTLPLDEIGAVRVPITEDILDPPPVEEIELTLDGRFAFARARTAGKLVAVDLESQEVTDVPAGDDPSDMDLTPDGQSVVVVSRGTQEVLVFDAHDPLAEPEVIPVPSDVTAGSIYLSPTGDGAVLYSTAVAQDRFGWWDMSGPDVSVHPLVKPVASARVAPDGASLLFFHTLGDTEGAAPDAYTNQWALSIVRVSDFLVEPVILSSEADAYTDSDDGRFGAFLMKNNQDVGVIDYRHLLVDDVTVPSPPRYLGMLPGQVVSWVSQDHPLGRISFLDTAELSTLTVTGFELNSEIEE